MINVDDNRVAILKKMTFVRVPESLIVPSSSAALGPRDAGSQPASGEGSCLKYFLPRQRVRVSFIKEHYRVSSGHGLSRLSIGLVLFWA